MSTCALAAVGRARREAGVALAADLLVAVVLGREHLQRGLDDATTETQDKVEGRLLLDVVIRQCPAVLELLASEDQALLVRGDTEGKAVSDNTLERLWRVAHPSLS